MALHQRLTTWQKVILGIVCFPVLPFYLCFYCLCCRNDKKKEGDLEEGHRSSGHQKDVENRQPDQSIRLSLSNKDDVKQKKQKSSFTNKGFENDEGNKDMKREREGHQKDVEKKQPDQSIRLSFSNKGFKNDKGSDNIKRKEEKDDTIDEVKQKKQKSSFTNKGFENDEVNKDLKREREGHQKVVENQQQDQSIRLSFSNKEQEVKDSRYPQDAKKQKINRSVKFGYPWDKSCLKSMEIDLKKFEELDQFASKLDTKGTIAQLVKELVRGVKTDLEKIRTIWIWICHHIEYDVHGYKNPGSRSSNPDDVFRARKGVCAGYSSLFDNMCSIAGVRCKTVSGYGKGASYKVGQKIPADTNHAWNMVYLEERWHLLDSTWGAGHSSMDVSTFTFCYNEFYFLTHPALFIGDHIPESADCQLLETPLSLKQFERSAYIRSNFYSLGLVSCQPQTAIVEAVKGKASIQLESWKNLKFSFNLNGQDEPGILTLLDNGMKLDVYPQTTGQHVLNIYAKRGDSEGSLEHVLKYQLECKHIDSNMKIPKCLSQPVGPSWLCEQAGLTNPSHPDPIIYTEDGSFTVSFLMKQKLYFLCSLISDEVKMTPEMENEHTLKKQTVDKVEMKVHLPKTGTYVLEIYIKPHTSENEEYNYICNYLIICANQAVKWPKFPLMYGNWAENYELVQPLEGVLPKHTNIPFTLYIPDVAAVRVDGQESVPLTLSDNGYWEGMHNTADNTELIVVIKEKNEQKVWYHLIKYNVTNQAS